MRRPPRHRTGAVLAALLLAVIGVAGCGESESDEDKVESTIAGFFDDVAGGKGDAACARLTGSAVRELSAAAFLLQAPASCPEAVKLVNDQLSEDEKDALRSAKVNRVVVTADKATVADSDIEVELKGQSGLFRNNNPKPWELEKSGDDWKISSVG